VKHSQTARMFRWTPFPATLPDSLLIFIDYPLSSPPSSYPAVLISTSFRESVGSPEGLKSNPSVPFTF
jgi:hypothetical protein